MDIFRNLISQFQKSRQKPGNLFKTNTSNSIENVLLNKPANNAATGYILQSNVDIKANITEEISASNDKEISEKDDSIPGEENLNKTTGDDKITNESDVRFIERLLNNTGVTTCKASCTLSDASNNIQIEAKNCASYDINNNTEKVVKVETLYDTTIHVNKTIYLSNGMSDVLEKGLANNQNKAANEANEIPDSTDAEIEKETMNEQTKKCLKEFDEVLTQVKKRHDPLDTEDLSLDDIDDIISSEDLEDDSNTYSFQEIKYAVDDEINWNEETQFVMEANITFIGHILENIVSNSFSEIAAKLTKKDNMDVISIISDDTANTDDVEETNNIETAPNEIETDGVETNQRKENIKKDITAIVFQPKAEKNEVIETISSGDDTDDGGYHSSDFEFISEEEAKLDGFIINFNPERHRKFGQNNNDREIKRANRFQYDPYAPGSSRNRRKYYYKGNKPVVDKSYVENYAVPHDNEFVNMFQGIIPGLPQSEIHFLENKSVRTRAPMLVQYEGLGFDMNLVMQRVDSSTDEEYREEAQESLKKILEMYPEENAKRRRRK